MRLNFDTIFRQYDVRGVYGDDLTDEKAEWIGKAFGTYIKRKGETKAVVGMDNRKSSPVLRQSIIKGLRSTGINVVGIGTVITPIFYYSTIDFHISSGIMVTASHNPAQYNGFKIQYAGRTLFGPELQEIKEIALKGSFEHGEGGYENCSPVEDYFRMMMGKIKLGNRKLKVVADAGNGTAGEFAIKILEEIGCEVIPLYCDSDPSFPHHFPDPTRVDNMRDLIRSVRENKADVGLGFDGDGDRLGVVDETGEIIWGDRIMVLYWREILPKHPGADAIVEVKCSDQLVDEIKKLGGNPMFYKTGHSLIKAKMKEINAVFTGEMSGHMFFADEYFGYDDAVYAAARLLRILSNTGDSLHQLLSGLPKSFATPEIRVPCKEEEKNAYVEKARVELRKFALDTIEVDGVRARFNDGWGLVRASNTGPELIVRCEGKTKEACQKIKQVISQSLRPLNISVQ
ncbi:MAG TPA: phosphomannomutase/phosphoglucomutase [Clostridia bacterium]|nr:phosphomannomutase/phosphoglucomutase [Clostridia bacterium]